MQKTPCLAIFLWLIYSSNFSWGQVQCTVDVSITEGDSISFCSDSPITLNASNGFVSYTWAGPQTGSLQSLLPSSSGQFIVSATDGVGCVSEDTIIVTVFSNPADVILSSEGNPICSNTTGTILSLQNSYVSYDWGGGITTPSNFVTTTGTYIVTVVDINGCAGNSAITLGQYSFSVNADQNSLCSGSTVAITANGGDNYLWSTGETSNTIVVSPTVLTEYWVEISASNCADTLYQSVDAIDPFSFSLPDTIYLAPGDLEYIEGPTGFTSYLWSPSDNIANPLASTAAFYGNSSQLITLTADYQGLCTFTDSVYMMVVDLTIPGGFSPNGDSKNQYFVVPQLMFLDASLKVWNRWGDVVYQSENYKNTWDGDCETGLCLGNGPLPEGTYFYLFDVQGIIKKGHVTLKR